MTDNAKTQTAKIYQFPAGGRAGLGMQHDALRGGSAPQSFKQPKAVLGGGCWYHDEAIKEVGLDNAG